MKAELYHLFAHRVTMRNKMKFICKNALYARVVKIFHRDKKYYTHFHRVLILFLRIEMSRDSEIYFWGLKYCANQRCDSRNPSANKIFYADPFFHVIHLLLSVFSPPGVFSSRSMRRKRISVFSRRPAAHGTGVVVAECPFIFIFVASPVALFLPIFI